MAKKLLILTALAGLVLLALVAPGLANYTLPGGDASTLPSPWNEGHGYHYTLDDQGQIVPYGEVMPGLSMGTFNGGFSVGDLSWNIPEHVSLNAGQVINESFTTDGSGTNTYWVTYKIVYDSGNLGFTALNYGGPAISSSNTVITTISTYKADDTYTPINNNGYFLQGQTMTMSGTGTNSDGTPFTFTADLNEVYWDHNHSGYITNFDLVYPAPLPGAAWLLGSGLLGLGCLGWRRRT